MASDMVERVARALCVADGREPDADWRVGEQATLSVAVEHPENWRLYEKKARAAIAAMRDLPEEPGPRYTAGEYSRRNVEALVDDALAPLPA